MAVKDAVARGLRRTLEARGYRVEPRSIKNDSDLRRARLLERQGIQLVLDVGANDGMYGSWLRDAGYEGDIHSFEPLGRPYEALAAAARDDARWTAHNLALSDSVGEAVINISTRDSWSSLLPADERAVAPELEYVGSEIITTARLDDLDVMNGTPTWLKLDVQGFELTTLAGATRTLASVVGVECEMSLEPLYTGQPTAREIVDYFDDRGFTLASADNGRVRESGRAVWLDGTFIRSDM